MEQPDENVPAIELSEQATPQRQSKRTKKRETEDSERTITLVKKKTQAKKFNKNSTPVNIFEEMKDEPTKKRECIKNQAESFNSYSNDYEISFSNKKSIFYDLVLLLEIIPPRGGWIIKKNHFEKISPFPSILILIVKENK